MTKVPRAHRTLPWQAKPAILILAILWLWRVLLPLQDPALDPDWYWHLSYGNQLLGGSFPRTEWLLWPFLGQAYESTQWLGEFVLALAHKAGGYPAVRMLTVSTLVLTTGITALACRRSGVSPLNATLIAIAATWPIWSAVARPQVFGFALGALLVLVLERDPRLQRTATRVQIVSILAAWANFHASFAAGLAYLVVHIACELLDDLTRQGSQEEAGPRWLLTAVMTCLISVVATFLTPEGLSTWRPLIVTGGAWSTRTGIIAEWQPTSLGLPIGGDYFTTVFALVTALAFATRRPSWGRLAKTLLIVAFGLGAVRQTFLAAIALAPQLAYALQGSRLAELIDSKVPTRIQGKHAFALLVAAGLLGLGMAPYYGRQQAYAFKKIFPVQAIAFVQDAGIQGRMWNEITAGGWIGAKGLHPLVDGRTDLFLDEVYFDHFYTRQAAPGWQQRLAKYSPDYFVIQDQSPLRQALLLDPQYRLVYDDGGYSVVIRPSTQPAHAANLMAVPATEFRIFDKEGNLLPTLLGY